MLHAATLLEQCKDNGRSFFGGKIEEKRAFVVMNGSYNGEN